MLSPKRTKFRKAHKGRIKGVAKGGFTLSFGGFGLKALEPERVTARQIEAARVARVEVLEAEALARCDAEPVQDASGALGDHACFPRGATTIHSAAPACNRNVIDSATA